MALKTAEQYYESLRQVNHTAYILGEKIPNPMDHPLIKGQVAAVAQTYALARSSEGKGLLGLVLLQGQTLRVDRVADDPRSAGFPPHHPVMTSLIGLPIVYEGRSVGDLYLADKSGGQPFTREDEEMLRTFAAHAAIAIENARLYRQVQNLAVLEERDRIGMDLHDGVIQSLYATGLTLENCLEDLEQDPAQVQPQIQKAIHDLNWREGGVNRIKAKEGPISRIDIGIIEVFVIPHVACAPQRFHVLIHTCVDSGK